MIIAIHQPNFIPWLPFFEKIKKSDIFVLLCNCQFEKNNYQNRFNLDDKWFTMSVNKGLESIANKKYLNPRSDFETIKRKLQKYNKVLSLFDDCICESLYMSNSNIIKKIADILEIKTHIVFDTPTDKKSTERLVEICKSYNADQYLAGPGGKNYMDMSLFDENNISVLLNENCDKRHILEILNEII